MKPTQYHCNKMRERERKKKKHSFIFMNRDTESRLVYNQWKWHDRALVENLFFFILENKIKTNV